MPNGRKPKGGKPKSKAKPKNRGKPRNPGPLASGGNAVVRYENGSILTPMSYAKASRPLQVLDRGRVTGRILYEPAYVQSGYPVICPITKFELIGTRLGAELALWEYWTGKFSMEFVPSVTFTTPGTIFMSGDSDINDVPARNYNPTQIMDQPFSVASPIIRGCTAPLPYVQKRLYTDCGDAGDLRFHSPGYFMYKIVGSGFGEETNEPADATALTSVGNLYLHYDLVLSVPSLSDAPVTSVITGFALSAANTVNPANTVSATAGEFITTSANMVLGRQYTGRYNPGYSSMLNTGNSSHLYPPGCRYWWKTAGAMIDAIADTYTLITAATDKVGEVIGMGGRGPTTFSSAAAATMALKQVFLV
jgi:hypothetical protein